jgi:hypothetical protein
VPGVTFAWFVGSGAPERHDAGAVNGQHGRFMWLCRFEEDPLSRGFARLVGTRG